MIKSKHMLLAGVAMTAAELSKGRYMRAPDGHDGGTPAPSPAPSPTPAPAPAAEGGEGGGNDAPEAGAGFFDPNEVEDSSGQAEPATPEKTGEEGKAPEDDGSEGADPAKKGKSVEERIGEVTATAREAERRAAEATREAKEWREKAEALAPKKGEEEGNVDPNAEPDPLDYEFGEADPQYTRDLATHAARQEFQFQERQSRLKGDLASLDSKWEAGIAAPELKEKYPDFDEKVTKGAETAAWACPPLIALGIKDSAVGPDVAYHLASNPEESRRIAQMNGIEQARHFGMLEGRFMRDAELAKTEAKPVPKPSAAPEPPANRTRGAGGKFAVDADTDDFSAFKKMAAPIMNKGVHKGSRD